MTIIIILQIKLIPHERFCTALPWLIYKQKKLRLGSHLLVHMINAVKCNLKELTIKSAWVSRSAVFSTRMLGGWQHRPCDSLARSVFPSCWVLPAFVFPSRPSPRPVGFFLHWCFRQCDGCLFLSFGVGAHGWVALLCQSWGHYFNLGAGCQ